MSQIPDSGDPGDVYGAMGLGNPKPAVLTDATWRHITERFSELRELGEGGQSLVFEGKEKEKPHRPVAIKVYRASTDTDRRLFEREVANVGSPYLPRDLVVGFYGVCRDEGIQPYLVLERISASRHRRPPRDRERAIPP